MSETVIKVEGLGKKYHIGARQTRRYRTLRDSLTNAVVAPFRRASKLLRGHATGAAELDEEMWALKDVSFEIKRGEVVGIIGRNGAGKSTLLKVLSRITDPTEGYAEITGRIGSLLEVGTGFHPELTGRENVYLNGAILGMKRAEIDLKFDQIVEFAEIDRFIDTPVKHYSTGMALRLAFGVAAHLEPEILLVDEVLAVGDASFQRKCLGKMEEVAQTGRTVLFVSHNMGVITELCGRCYLIDDGRIAMTGRAPDVVAAYLSGGVETSGTWQRSEAQSAASESELDVVVESIRVLSDEGEPTALVPFNRSFQVEISYKVVKPVRDLVVLCGVTNDLGVHVWTSYDTDTTDWAGRTRDSGSYVSTCSVPAGLLRPGRYHLSACALIPRIRIIEPLSRIMAFDITSVGYGFDPERHGAITPSLEWKVMRNGQVSRQAGSVDRIDSEECTRA